MWVGVGGDGGGTVGDSNVNLGFRRSWSEVGSPGYNFSPFLVDFLRYYVVVLKTRI